jgi:hypothetical protein
MSFGWIAFRTLYGHIVELQIPLKSHDRLAEKEEEVSWN